MSEQQDDFADIVPRQVRDMPDDEVLLAKAESKSVVVQLREQGLETMNRECRRKHTKFWQVKDIASGIRLVRCTKCGGQTYERKQ